MDTTPEKQVGGVPEGAEQVGDASSQQAAVSVGGGVTEATHTDTQPETEQTDSFSERDFLAHGLTPTLNRISLGTQQPGLDSAQRNTTVAQLRENIETQTSVENTARNTVATHEPQGEAQASAPRPSHVAPAQLAGGRDLFRENEMRVREMQMRQRVERDGMYGYTQTYPYTQPYPPSYAHSAYSQA